MDNTVLLNDGLNNIKTPVTTIQSNGNSSFYIYCDGANDVTKPADVFKLSFLNIETAVILKWSDILKRNSAYIDIDTRLKKLEDK